MTKSESAKANMYQQLLSLDNLYLPDINKVSIVSRNSSSSRLYIVKQTIIVATEMERSFL